MFGLWIAVHGEPKTMISVSFVLTPVITSIGEARPTFPLFGLRLSMYEASKAASLQMFDGKPYLNITARTVFITV